VRHAGAGAGEQGDREPAVRTFNKSLRLVVEGVGQRGYLPSVQPPQGPAVWLSFPTALSSAATAD
jgi:hypothetical protein